MAISPSAKYPAQTLTTDPGYPQGKAKNVISEGDGTGTPYEADLVNDIFGFQQALLSAVGATPTGTPDKVGASQYLDAARATLSVQRWGVYKKDADGNAIANSYVRDDGTSKIFWSDTFRLFIACGINVANDFYYSWDGEIWQGVALGIDGVKFQHGCAASDRILLFDRSATAGNTYLVSGASDFTSWTPKALTSGFEIVQDAVYIPGLASVVVVGAAAGTYFSFKSTDNGVTFGSLVTIGSAHGAMNYLNRVILGASNRIFAFDNDTTANGGNKLWYSDDAGATWHSVTLTSGVDQLSDACYDATSGVYYFASKANKRVYVFTDPTSIGSELVRSFTGSVDAIQVFSGLLVVSTSQTLGGETMSLLLGSRDQGATMKELQRVPNPTNFLAVSGRGRFAGRATNAFVSSLRVGV